MNQREVNNALTIYLDSGDSGPWMRVLEAIRDGQVTAETSANTLRLKAITRPATADFGKRISDLRAASGMELQTLADLLDISFSTVIRQMRGQVLGPWSGVSMMIEAMGGNPADYKQDHAAAKAESYQGRHVNQKVRGEG